KRGYAQLTVCQRIKINNEFYWICRRVNQPTIHRKQLQNPLLQVNIVLRTVVRMTMARRILRGQLLEKRRTTRKASKKMLFRQSVRENYSRHSRQPPARVLRQ
ncbi:hypothetical protein TcCL_Unassigned04444, partial [Trypanosoma cruzi]